MNKYNIIRLGMVLIFIILASALVFAECVPQPEYWYDTVDKNCDGVAGLIEWNDAINSNSYNINDLKYNLTADYELAYDIYEHLRGKTIIWNLSYKPEEGVYSNQVNLIGQYTFPDAELPLNRYSIFFKVDNQHVITILNDHISMEYSPQSYGVTLYNTPSLFWDEDSNSFKNYTVGFSHPSWLNEEILITNFRFWPTAIKKEIPYDNWRFTVNYRDSEKNWVGYKDYRDKEGFPLGRLIGGSYIQLKRACLEYSLETCDLTSCHIEGDQCRQGSCNDDCSYCSAFQCNMASCHIEGDQCRQGSCNDDCSYCSISNCDLTRC
ncbi:MAG: hypothetical protein ABIJ08_01250, partial [Nanoarchaeota archaeon]